MSDTTCDRCGARFDVPRAVGTLDQHMANFHPGAASKAQLRRAEKQGDTGEQPVTSEGGLTTLPGGGADTGEGQGETPTPTETEKPLDKMTTAQLEAVATAEKIDLSGASTNKERAAAIEKARAATS